MTRIPQREEQALREVGQTSITARTGWILVLLFLLTLVSVALLEPMAQDSDRGAAAETESTAVPSLGPWQEFARGISASFRTARNQGLLEANHELLAVMDSFELRLEEESFLRRLVLPPLQGFLTTHLGVGNGAGVPRRERAPGPSSPERSLARSASARSHPGTARVAE